MYLLMQVYGFTLDSIAQMPVVILKDAEEKHTLPIWINSLEAVSIAAEMIGRDVSVESGCADLLTKLLAQMNWKVDKITIDDLKDGVFDATILFACEAEVVKVTARPSEALVMALKYGMPLHISLHVLAKAATVQASDEIIFDDTDGRRFVDFLENLDPKDLGRYPM